MVKVVFDLAERRCSNGDSARSDPTGKAKLGSLTPY